MIKILLNVIGTQRIDRQRDKIEMTTVATLEEDSLCYTINYSEEQEPPSKPTHVCVKVNKNEKLVEMTRSGDHDSCLVIEKSKRNLCHYNTEYGDILMGISGHNIDVDFDGESGQFIFTYDIDVNGALTSKNEVKLSFRKNQE